MSAVAPRSRSAFFILSKSNTNNFCRDKPDQRKNSLIQQARCQAGVYDV